MELYILKSGSCLAVFYGFYKLLLEKESIHTFKRFYLLTSLITAFYIPLIVFTQYIEVTPQVIPEFSKEANNTPINPITPQSNYLPIILWTIYGLGVFLFSFKFIKNLIEIVVKIKRNPKYKSSSFTNVLLQDLIVPHTFFSYIFLNKHKFETNQIPKEVILHEETHAKQKHSIDILLIEILQILCWFNPLIYLIKHSIKLNHEFLADQTVINQGASPSTYQQTLLTFSSNAPESQLTNALNYSSIKKRFTLMKTQTSKRTTLLKSFILMPLLALLVYGFSTKIIVEKPQFYQEISFQDLRPNEGATESMMKEYNDYMAEYENNRRHSPEKIRRAAAIYNIMTDAQRASVKKYNEKFFNDISSPKIKLKHPTQSELDSWKNSSELTIYINNRHIKNLELSNYSPSDFVYFSLSFKSKKKRNTGNFKPNACDLYTNEGFKRIILKTNFTDYHRLFVKYINEIDTYLNSDQSDDSELRILKIQLDHLYANFSEREIKAYNPPISPPLPIKGNTKYPKTKKISKKVAEYNALAKKHNTLNNGHTYPDDEIDRLYILYKQLTPKEKVNAVIFPNLPYTIQKDYEERKFQKEKDKKHSKSNSEKTSKSKQSSQNSTKKKLNKPQQKATPKQIAAYNKLAKYYNNLPKGKRNSTIKDVKDLQYLYSIMSKAQKAKAEPYPNCIPAKLPAAAEKAREAAAKKAILKAKEIAREKARLAAEESAREERKKFLEKKR